MILGCEGETLLCFGGVRGANFLQGGMLIFFSAVSTFCYRLVYSYCKICREGVMKPLLLY